MISITRKFTFAYSHQLPNYEGKCKNLHGHTGMLEIEIIKTNTISCKYPGMVMDFSELDKLVKREVIDHLDHHHLNDLIDIPTAENTCIWILKRLQEVLGFSLKRIKLYETPNSYAEWRRDGEEDPYDPQYL